jgi:hypothetical protein
MTEQPLILCKPTTWFWSRAFGMLAMLTFLGGWFFKDALVGYRDKNLVFHWEKAFDKVANDYLADKNAGKSDDDWRAKAEKETATLGDDPSILPVGTVNPAPWPTELKDPAIISKGPDDAFNVFRARMKYNKPDEKIHDAGSIREQFYYAYGLTAMSIYTLFILIRTARRSISADATSIRTQEGRTVLFSSMYELDLRKWGNKGLAFAKYKTPEGASGVVRIDGLTYGGFKIEQNEPAEQLMRRIKDNFHGEIIDYETAESEAKTDTEPDQDNDQKSEPSLADETHKP